MAPIVSDSYTKKLLRLISWGHWFTFFNIGAVLILSSFYFWADPAPTSAIGIIYLATNWLSHMAFLTLMSFVLLVFPIILLFPQTRFVRGYASLVFTLSLILLVLDTFAYNKLGYHLSNSSFTQLIDLITDQIRKDPFAFWSGTLIVGGAVLVFELVVSNYAWKHIKQLQQTVFAKYTVGCFVSLFIMSHLIHMWSDAKLDYDVLKQDTMMPFSYPLTAKTLLAKYDLFDEQGYSTSKKGLLTFNDTDKVYPAISSTCPSKAVDNSSVYLILSKNNITTSLNNQFNQRRSAKRVKLNRHINSSSMENAWFSLLYSLPSPYKNEVLAQDKKPMILQAVDKLSMASTFNYVGNEPANIPAWIYDDVASVDEYESTASLLFKQQLNKRKSGLHIIYFDNDSTYQLELFVDALLLNQKQREQKDIIFISQLGNESIEQAFEIKPTFLVLPSAELKTQRMLTSQFDVIPTLMHAWLKCDTPSPEYSAGVNILTLNKNRLIADIVHEGMMVYDKDQSVFIDQKGSFQSFSRRLNEQIEVPSNYPLLIDAAQFIKQFDQRAAN